MTSPRAVLRLTDVVKAYPGVVALRGASLEVVEGEVHAVVGENGAGKSTLMAVAAGAVVADSGTIEIGGHAMSQPSPVAAQALGLAVVYQHTSVIEDLTVTENMVFAMPRERRPPMSRARAWARERLVSAGAATIDPGARGSDLSVAEHQLLEIARALALEARVLILDEPTESLTALETDRLFERIAAIRDGGAAVVYISHRLPEVMRIADRVTVMRDGEVRATLPIGEVSEADVLRLIVGRSIDRVFPPKAAEGTAGRPAALEVRDLRGTRFRGVSLQVRPGEIVGLAGVEGNGQREFLRALSGLGRIAGGDVLVEGRPVRLGEPRHAVSDRLVHLPADRHREGLFMSLSVRQNISVLALPGLTSTGLVRRDRESALARTQIDRLDIRTPSPETGVDALSGGNQQKVLIARSMLAEPRVLLADEPTSGVDVGARVEIYRILRDAAEAGQVVVVLSSDVVELQGLCDRVLVFSRGEVVLELAGEAITEDAITGAAITSTAQRASAADRRAQRLDRMRRFLAGDYAPSLVLTLLIVALAAYTGAANDRFFSALSIQGLLLLASALVFVSLGQQVVVLAGGLDLSVGALAGIVVIVLSSFVSAGAGVGSVGLALAIAVGTGVLVGLANGLLVRFVRLPPVLATLSTLIVLQGIALLLRPQPGGLIARPFTDLLKTTIGPIPVAFVVAVLATIACEWALRRTRAGMALRAVGSDEVRAHRLGARVGKTHVAAFVACSLFAVAGGVMLSSQVGIGDARLGGAYALTSITAVVLGGTSIFGGRGSFVGAFLGACLIQEIVSATTFLRFGTAWQYWLPGILVLVAAGLYSRARGVRAAALAGEEAS